MDRIIWAHTLSSMFITSSAYKLLVSCESVSNAGTSNMKIQKINSGRIYGSFGFLIK